MEKGSTILYHTTSIWTSKAAGHGGLAVAVVGKGDHICLWVAVIYFLEFAVVSSA